jgi:hypothetical protein
MMLFNRDSAIQSASWRFCTIYRLENLVPCQQPDAHLSKASSVQTTRTFCLELPLCWEASNCSSLHSSELFSRTSARVSVFDKLQDFFSKHSYGKIPATVRTMYELIQKASIGFKIQTSGRQSAWSRRTSIRYGNCVHQINCLDDHPLGPEAWSLGMEITCSESTTVRMTRHHRQDVAQTRKEFQWTFQKADRTVVRPDALWLLSGRSQGFIKPDAYLNPQPINRGT